MSHKSKKSLYQQTVEALEAKAHYGHSKHADKRAGVSSRYIYSFETMATYKKHCVYFIEWARDDAQIIKDLGHKPRTLAEIRPYAEQWLQKREAAGLSASTVQMERAALSKLYGEQIAVQLKAAKRAEIKRSRGTAARDRNFNERRHADLVNFCRCAGPRRAELTVLQASALEYHEGRPYVHYTDGTKGGRERLSPLMGTEDEIARAVAFLERLDGTQKVNTNADIHSYRADYAMRVYKAAAQPIEDLRGKKINITALTGKTGKNGKTIYKSAIYTFRGDRKGEKLDRAAMYAASRALGHNREDVVGNHYLLFE